MNPRLLQSFPTRIFPYRKAPADLAAETAGPLPTLPAGVFRFRLGRDARPLPMTAGEIAAELGDPFAQLLLGRGLLPLSLRSLLAALDARNGDPEGIPEQRSFLVADGGKIPWTPETANLRREFRFVLTRGKSGGAQPDLMVSASTNIDSESIFLQLIAWDPVHEVFNFYQRLGLGWGWAGNSWDALAGDTRGKGPFDSHVNGAMVMKELKAPWLNWNSQASSITDEALAPDDPLRLEPLYVQKQGAQQLETEVVRPGIRRWNDARFKQLFVAGTLSRAREFLRQALFTTTVNLCSAPEESSLARAGTPIHLPLGFFLNAEALLNLLQIPVNIQRPQVDGGIYAQCLQRYHVALSDGTFVLSGDTHFLFVVPEPAFEDQVVLQKLVLLQIVPHRLAAALLMVDLPNPLFSPRREALLPYLPDSARVGPAGSDVAAQIVAAMSGHALPGSPESEFLANWALPDAEWMGTYARRIEAYMGQVANSLQSLDGFDPMFRLAESRRREFRRRPLAEFRLTTPLTDIPEDAPLLEMTVNAAVQNKIFP